MCTVLVMYSIEQSNEIISTKAKYLNQQIESFQIINVVKVYDSSKQIMLVLFSNRKVTKCISDKAKDLKTTVMKIFHPSYLDCRFIRTIYRVLPILDMKDSF